MTKIEIIRNDGPDRHCRMTVEDFTLEFFEDLLEVFIKEGHVKSFAEGSDGWKLIKNSGLRKAILVKEDGKVLVIKPDPIAQNDFKKFLKAAGKARHLIRRPEWSIRTSARKDVGEDVEIFKKLKEKDFEGLKYAILNTGKEGKSFKREIYIQEPITGEWI